MAIFATINKMNLNKNFANNYQLPADSTDQTLISNLNEKSAADLKLNLSSNLNTNLNTNSNIHSKVNSTNFISEKKQPLYFLNLDNYLHHQLINNNVNKLQPNQFYNKKNSQQINLANPQDNQQQSFLQKMNTKSKELINSPTDLSTESTLSNFFNCFDRITIFVERRLNCQPIYNLIKCFIVLLTVVQFCIFLLSVITYKNYEQAHFYPKHGDYFLLGTNLANLNALLSTIFYLYSIICEVWPLLTLMTSLQAFYSIIELLALLFEPIKVQNIYIIFIMLTSLQTTSMLLFVVMLRVKKLQERKLNNSNV